MNFERSVSPELTASSSILAIGRGSQKETSSLLALVTLPRFTTGVILSLIKQVKRQPSRLSEIDVKRSRLGVLHAQFDAWKTRTWSKDDHLLGG
jgi:hypothetical protein